jgi:Ran GTPase-activating protein (RanGAP) involved in mRNA processing and transport
MNLMVAAIADRFNSTYELELIWHIIAKIREHYRVVDKKRQIAKENDQEESGDEASDDEEEAERVEKETEKTSAK